MAAPTASSPSSSSPFAAGPFGSAPIAARRRGLGALTSKPAFRILEHELLVFRRGWHSYLLSGLTQPFLYLLSMGIGLGLYVNRNGGTPGGVPYLDYIAPALLVTQAMTTAAFASAWPIVAKFQWEKTYLAAINTPLRPMDLMAGDLMWVACRLGLIACLFFVAVIAFGAVTSPLAILAIPVAILTGLAFAAPIMAYSATLENDQALNMLFRFGITPLFLFSGTFFPIESLPGFLQPLAWATPLFHGVAIARSLSLGHLDPVGDLIHIAVLGGFIVVGVAAARVTYKRRLAV
jgi:lipooligosaccharide transport system permease protein